MNLIRGDCRDAMEFSIADDSVDSVVTDPPYGLTSARPSGRSEATRGAVMGGFMGMKWDRGVPGVEFWEQALRVLKPGGHLLAFGGSRTYHRLACAIEDAGFEIRDQIMWVYGSGFPKASNLKPAHEPICVARKPFKGSAEQNMTLWGVGNLRVGDCRVGDSVRTATPTSLAPMHGNRFGDPTVTEHRDRLDEKTYVGRWPANLIHDGSDEVLDVFPQAPGQLADASSSSDARKTQNVYGAMRCGRGDEASADSANRGEVGFKMRPGARRLDSGSAARFFYCAKASKSDRGEGNTHPTVKPTELMRYLCRLVTPVGGMVLDPFMGSGSTGKAAVLEGFRFTGIDLDPEYVHIARARINGAVPE